MSDQKPFSSLSKNLRNCEKWYFGMPPSPRQKKKEKCKKKKLKTIDILNSYSFSRQITEEMWKKWHFYLILGSTSEKKLENLEKFRIPVPFQRSFSLGKNGMSEKKIND